MAKKKEKIQNTQTFRQPIVTVMGHVDHGKTTFLDTVRGSRVAEKEAGGITQNTRMHEVTTKNGAKITFIDTPGHEAFSKMRERGAAVTDIVLLMVAADDGVQPQTKESIKFAKDHNVPIIVAINKIDIEGVDIRKIKKELSSYGVNIEEFGGETMCFPISAKNNIGIDEVLDGILLLAEMNQLASHKTKEGVVGEAFVLESRQDKHLGYIAMCILKAGELTSKYFGATSSTVFKTRSYLDENLKPVETVKEAQPFIVIGLNKDLVTGDIINFVTTEKEALDLQAKLKSGEIVEEEKLPEPQEGDLSATESLFAQLLLNRKEKEEGVEQKELKVILRASTQGTLEAIQEQLKKLDNKEAKVTILQSGTGIVTEEDITRAKVAKAIIISFQNPTPGKIKIVAKKERVLLRDYEIIYNIIDEIKEVLISLGEPTEEEVEIARAKVKLVFTLTNGDIVAGCEVINGTLKRGHNVWVERKDGKDIIEIGRSKIKNLKKGKEEAKEIKRGVECGILLEQNFRDLQVGDAIVSYKVEKY